MLLIFFTFSAILSLSILFLKNRVFTQIATSLFLVAQIAVSLIALAHPDKICVVYFKFDAIGVLLSLVLSILSIATFYHSRLYLKRHATDVKKESVYYASLIMLIVAMMSAYFAENIAVLWVSIEATTLLVSILIFHERSKEALEAAWKYLFISSVGVAFAFIGILFLSMAASNNGLTDLSLANLLLVAHSMSPLWLKIAFLLVLTGFSAKMGLFPLHTVAVDAHTVAPPPISAFISTALMNVGFLGIFRIYTVVAQTDILGWAQHVLLIAGTLSVLMSAIQMLRIKHYKRMFAFSSLEHMGIVALGLGIGGLGYYAAILHLIFHSFVKASLFYQIGQVHQFFKSYWIKDVSGYFKLNPVGGLSLLLGVISILAIPPSGLFISEFISFKAMILGGHLYLAIFILMLLTLIIYTFTKNALHLLYDTPPPNLDVSLVKMNPFESISQFVLLGLVIYLGINPPLFFTDLIHAAIAILN
jgi:hydrogenase-4 component F